ncbi:hypothetical protein [Bacillus cereus]|uniref:hypothetical protein n=1 Tax=Bacillus cereus TaxID=1396 RepID=UPI00031ED848|nr:hypothetical protein [Bacillus cereus]
MSRLYRDIEDIEHSKELLLSNVCGSGIRNILVARYSPVSFFGFLKVRLQSAFGFQKRSEVPILSRE